MTYGSARNQEATGTSNIQYNLPDSTYLIEGAIFEFNNNSTGTLTIKKYDNSTLVYIVPAGGFVWAVCDDNTTQNGVMGRTRFWSEVILIGGLLV